MELLYTYTDTNKNTKQVQKVCTEMTKDIREKKENMSMRFKKVEGWQ